MSIKSNYIYISSKNRGVNEKVYDFNVILNNPIILNQNQGLNISVVGFSMLNTDYNLRSSSFIVQELHYTPIIYSLVHTVNIPDGNYNYLTLINFLNNYTPIKDIISFEYVKERNSIKFANKLLEGDINIVAGNCSNFLGINNSKIVTTTYEGSYINLTNYSHIIIKSNSILFEDNTQDNINNKEMGNSSILFMIDKQDVPPFQLISYRNHDKSDNYSYNINNRQISSIDLHLYNERGEVLKNADEYFLTLKIVIFNKDKPDVSIPFLEDIRFLLMNMTFNNRKNKILYTNR
jgi:hypothetical protein